jgi:hypothetical protein
MRIQALSAHQYAFVQGTPRTWNSYQYQSNEHQSIRAPSSLTHWRQSGDHCPWNIRNRLLPFTGVDPEPSLLSHEGFLINDMYVQLQARLQSRMLDCDTVRMETRILVLKYLARVASTHYTLLDLLTRANQHAQNSEYTYRENVWRIWRFR